jgi:EAL domain-containing protein (putative c-di-GMP-specific phosphodiesterase class I)
MSKGLSIKVIAEGVENHARLSFLRDHQCDEFQGYYFSRPVTAGDIESKFRESFALQGGQPAVVG